MRRVVVWESDFHHDEILLSLLLQFFKVRIQLLRPGTIVLVEILHLEAPAVELLLDELEVEEIGLRGAPVLLQGSELSHQPRRPRLIAPLWLQRSWCCRPTRLLQHRHNFLNVVVVVAQRQVDHLSSSHLLLILRTKKKDRKDDEWTASISRFYGRPAQSPP